MKKLNLVWSLLLTMALFFNGPLSQTAFAHYIEQNYEEEMFCNEEEQEQPCNRSLWIGGGVLGLATIGAIACTLSKHRNQHKGCHQKHCCNNIPDNGGGGGDNGGGAGGNLTATISAEFTTSPPLIGQTVLLYIRRQGGSMLYTESSTIDNQPFVITRDINRASVGPYIAYLLFKSNPTEFNGTLTVRVIGNGFEETNNYPIPTPTFQVIPELLRLEGYISQVNFIIQ